MDDKSEGTSTIEDDLKKEGGSTVSRPPSVPAGRPRLTAIHSSDASRLMTLERLQQNMTLKTPGNKKQRDLYPEQHQQQQQQNQERQLTIETAVFPEQQSIFLHNEKTRRQGGSGSQSDTKSVRSGSESTRAPTKRNRRRPHKSLVKPTEIFAQNLSDAVLDANDSDEQEAFVYRDHSSMYPTLPASFHWSASHDFKRHTDGDSFYSKPRRPVLRSAVSELPPSAMLRTSPFRPPHYKRHQPKHDWYPSDADEEAAPLLPRYASNGKRKRRQAVCKSGDTNRRKTIALWALFSACVAMTTMWFMLVFTALPLTVVEVLELSNVLGSTKELFFDLHVRARNSNFWSIQISHASFSVFASSHYVPTAQMAVNNTSSVALAAPVEFLGTIYQLDEPLVFQAARFFKPSVSIATSQIQIKDPGKTKGDSSGNERWSLLIRYPYELTVRGVLKYRVIPIVPWTQVHSARVCQVSRVDPATGDISNIPESEKTICDDPSPIETSIYPASV